MVDSYNAIFEAASDIEDTNADDVCGSLELTRQPATENCNASALSEVDDNVCHEE